MRGDSFTARSSPAGQAEAARHAHIPFLHLAAFTAPVILFQAIEMAWRAYLPRFLTQEIGMTLAMVGALMLGARLLDTVADPVLGWLSDGVRTRFGLRKPWMAIGALLIPPGALLLFLAPPGAGLAHILLASLLLHLGYSLILVPHGGWGLELSSDSYQRTRIMGAKIWFAMAGSMGMLAVLALLEKGLALPLASEMALLGWAIALLAPVTVLAVLLLFRERPAPLPAPAANPLVAFLAILRDPAMRAVLLLYVATGIADAASAGTFLFMAEDALGLKGWGASLMLLQPAIALVTLPLWGRLSRRIGRPRVLMIAYGWQVLTAPLLALLPAGQPALFAAFLALRALGWGVDYMLLRAMVADLADDGGAAAPRAGSYYGLSSVTLKLAMGLGAGGAIWLIGQVAGSAGGDATGGAMGPAIRLAYALPSFAMGLFALALLWRMRGGGRAYPTPPLGPMMASPTFR